MSTLAGAGRPPRQEVLPARRPRPGDRPRRPGTVTLGHPTGAIPQSDDCVLMAFPPISRSCALATKAYMTQKPTGSTGQDGSATRLVGVADTAAVRAWTLWSLRRRRAGHDRFGVNCGTRASVIRAERTNYRRNTSFQGPRRGSNLSLLFGLSEEGEHVMGKSTCRAITARGD